MDCFLALREEGLQDVVMKGRRAVVLVHGCFWHGHDCKRGARQPKDNAAYWRAKIGRNREVDMAVEAALLDAGWRVATVWECAIKGKERKTLTEIIEELSSWLYSSQRTLLVRS